MAGKVEKRLKELSREKSEDMGCKILALETIGLHLGKLRQLTAYKAERR